MGFKRLNVVLFLVVVLPDGTPGTIRAEATNVFGDAPVDQVDVATVLSAEGLRRLRVLIDAGKRGGAAAAEAVSR